MNLKIVANDLNLEKIKELSAINDRNFKFENEGDSLIVKYESKDDLNNILYVCASFLGFETLTVELINLIQERQLGSELVEIVQNELKKETLVKYLSLNIFKALKDYLDDGEVLNLSAFKKFNLSVMSKEADSLIKSAESHLKFREFAMQVDEKESIEELKEMLQRYTETSVDISMVLPLIRKIFNLEFPNEVEKHVCIKKEKNNYLLCSKDGKCLSLEQILDAICPYMGLEATNTNSFDRFLSDIVAVVDIFSCETILFYSELFEEKEALEILNVLKSLKRSNDSLRIFFQEGKK